MKKIILMLMLLVILQLHNNTNKEQRANVWFYNFKGYEGFPSHILGSWPIKPGEKYILDGFGHGTYDVQFEGGKRWKITLPPNWKCIVTPGAKEPEFIFISNT